MTAQSIRTWVDGVEEPVSDSAWDERRLTSLGCAYRVVVPAGHGVEAWWWARDRAREVASRFGATFDDEPWSSPGDTHSGWEVHGVWEHRFRAPLGSATTRVRPLPAPTALPRTVRAVRLPFPYGSRSALAGLPVPQPSLDAAARQLTGTVGLWFDHDDELCTTTAGPVALRTADGWLHPRPESGTVPTWAWERFVTDRGSRPAKLGPADLTGADVTAYAVSETGTVTELAP